MMNLTFTNAANKQTLKEKSAEQSQMVSKLVEVLHFWHLLSLDAPTVAALWTCFIAATLRVRTPRFAPFAMFLTVWIVYVGDRLLDISWLHPQSLDSKGLGEPHHFHQTHRRAFLLGIVGVTIPLALLILRIPATAVHLYLLLAGLLFGYFVSIHATVHVIRMPKGPAVGFIFAAAVFIPTVATRPDLRVALVPSGLLFAALCSLNWLFICSWERERQGMSFQGMGDTPMFIIPHYRIQAAMVVMIFGGVLPLVDRRTPWQISVACALSAMLLLQAHRNRFALRPITLRVTADLALLTPLLFMPSLSLI
jgi:hypothetical protein